MEHLTNAAVRPKLEGRFPNNNIRDAFILAFQTMPAHIATAFLTFFEKRQRGTVHAEELGLFGFAELGIGRRQQRNNAVAVLAGWCFGKRASDPQARAMAEQWIGEWESDPETQKRMRDAQPVLEKIRRWERECVDIARRLPTADPDDGLRLCERWCDLQDPLGVQYVQLTPERWLWREDARAAAQEAGPTE